MGKPTPLPLESEYTSGKFNCDRGLGAKNVTMLSDPFRHVSTRFDTFRRLRPNYGQRRFIEKGMSY